MLVTAIIPDAQEKAREATNLWHRRTARYISQGLFLLSLRAPAIEKLHVERGRRSSRLRQGISGAQQAAMTRYTGRTREAQITRRHCAQSAGELVRIKVYLRIAARLMAEAQSGGKKTRKDGLGSQTAILCRLVCKERIDGTDVPSIRSSGSRIC